MITIFSLPKPFMDHIGIIQRNAINSWMKLDPSISIILFGDEFGTKEVATEFGISHVPLVAKNQYGTPLIDDIFRKAEKISKNDILCYVNADIILMNDFFNAIIKSKTFQRPFLMSGRRWNFEINNQLDFSDHWDDELTKDVLDRGEIFASCYIDYFVFTQGLWKEIPPFAIGRTSWDNWLLYGAKKFGGILIDSTPMIMAIHQNHDYSHLKDGIQEAWNGLEAQNNRKMADGHIYSLDNSDFLLTKKGLKINYYSRLMKLLKIWI